MNSQYEKIKEHLLYKGSITSWEAIQKYRITRLSHYIWVLRKEGYVINDKWETKINENGEVEKWKEYSLDPYETLIRQHVSVID
jgi:hypothetical protein